MKCRKCGAELQENEKICSVCGQEAETVETNARKEETKETSDTADGLTASDQAPSGSPEPEKKKSGKLFYYGLPLSLAIRSTAPLTRGALDTAETKKSLPLTREVAKP